MLPEGLITAAYLIAGILFILSLSGLSKQETAKRGNYYGIVGMLLAFLATVAAVPGANMAILAGGIVVGAVIGAVLALRVQMTSMPQLVAILHSFVGLAAVLVGYATYLDPEAHHSGVEGIIHSVEIFLGVFIGAITFTGSVVAFGKLQGVIGSKPLMIPGRHLLNLAGVVVSIWLGVVFATADGTSTGLMPLYVMTAIACLIGIHMVMAIGGADMPVVVSMLNSYSGWAAAAAGFMLSNDLLIIVGALVGSSGAILSYIMCEAMNRSFFSVILGGFGAGAGKAPSSVPVEGEVTPIAVDETVELLSKAKSVIVVPGYGMAVAKAQYPLFEMAKVLKDKGVNVRYAIHPVAGRLPGHMNVLLAEARVPYDVVLEMEEINDDFPDTDVVLVIGANDIVNPGALDDPGSPIFGMPVLEVWKAKTSIVMKRGMAAGYAGVDNPLFFKENNRMLFGDAKDVIEQVLAGLR
jgi:NAD(P) transhydrogenase subunit beta